MHVQNKHNSIITHHNQCSKKYIACVSIFMRISCKC